MKKNADFDVCLIIICLTLSESCLSFFSALTLCVPGWSNPISASDPEPQDLLCLYQTCFMLCLLNSNGFGQKQL